MSGQVVLMKMAMGRYPAVDAVVLAGVLFEACKKYFAEDSAIAYVVGSALSSDSMVDPTNAIYIADLEDGPQFLSLLLVRGDPKRAIPAFGILALGQ
ncbi:hypothetical protein G6321_00026725 [Bradyrhizobium barranii subsp. barranii]|uniref:Uncharacterized protein n=1 Tax=Bradyrhizobium barranii subsp. barranii TaxID=2823807 RepID=A0A7Z0QJQ4_9BRAD|nr:hypothetical protein [Bradyrhizobium barranii]UGX98520.1 hypothetical protein G6321_00026725 [Bradyrhizobium barranii subsp. barranii]